jgi:outer membrane lipoprotein carrier protein
VAAPAEGGVAEKAAPDVDAIVDRLQKTYEGTNDFSARFTQRYTMMVLKKSQESSGTVVFAKPGKMRWDYVSPTKKSFVVANGKLHVVQPEDNTALIDHCFKEDGLTASVSFLWGSGRIKEEFDVAPFAGTFGAKTDHHLLLMPKAKNSVFAKIILVVDPATSRVKQSVVVDPQGNVNQFMFEDAKFNSGVKDARFAVDLPSSMAVSRMPGTRRSAPRSATCRARGRTLPRRRLRARSDRRRGPWRCRGRGRRGTRSRVFRAVA